MCCSGLSSQLSSHDTTERINASTRMILRFNMQTRKERNEHASMVAVDWSYAGVPMAFVAFANCDSMGGICCEDTQKTPCDTRGYITDER